MLEDRIFGAQHLARPAAAFEYGVGKNGAPATVARHVDEHIDTAGVGALLEANHPAGEDAQLTGTARGGQLCASRRGDAVAVLVPQAAAMAQEAALVVERKTLP